MSTSSNPHVNPFYIDPAKRHEWSGGALEMEDDDGHDQYDDDYDDEEMEQYGLISSGPEHDKRVFHDASYYNSHRGGTSNKDRRWILCIVCSILMVFVWMALQQQDKERQQGQDGNGAGDDGNNNHTFAYPSRVVLLGERHSGVAFYQEHLSRCFAHLPNQKWETFLTRNTTWFQDPPSDDKDFDAQKDIQFILVVRDPYTWVEAMRTEPLHSPRHADLDWKAFVTTPWTNTVDGDNETSVESSTTAATTAGATKAATATVASTTVAASVATNAATTTTTIPTTTTAATGNDAIVDTTNSTGDDDDDGALGLNVTDDDQDLGQNTTTDQGELEQNTTNDGDGRWLVDNDDNKPQQRTCQLKFTDQQVVPCQQADNPNDNASPIYELNPQDGKPFDSILDLRAAKLQHYYTEINSRYYWNTGRPLIVVRYEHSLWDSLQHVAKHAGEWGKSFECHNLKVHASDNDDDKKKKVAMEEIDADYVPYLTEHIQWKVEDLVGYRPRKTP